MEGNFYCVRFFMDIIKVRLNCKTLLKLQTLNHFWLDCLLNADDLGILNRLKNLRTFKFGVFLNSKETEKIFQA